MPAYTRTTFDGREFRDAFGAVIPYRARWTGPPPDDSYSRLSNPERFAPLQTIADALIQHLVADYRVDIARSGSSVSVTPDRADAAPLLLRYRDFPGVEVPGGRPS